MLRIEHNFAAGIPQTALAGFLPTAVFWHWTAGGTGRRGALGVVQHFINTRYSVNASYHLLLFIDEDTGETVAMWIVPPTVAAHSLNPAQAFKYNGNIDVDTQNEWFVEVARCLPGKAHDANAGAIAVSFCGMPADLEAALQSSTFVEDVRTLARQLEAIPSMVDGPHVNHGWIQPLSRYDAGDVLIPMLSPVDEHPDPEPVPPPGETPEEREARIANEVIELRSRHPQAAFHWANSSGLVQAADGKPLLRLPRLAGEVLYLRRVDHGDDSPTG